MLIIERTQNPGGYCKSFKKDGLTFDSCVHSLESLRPEGCLGRLFEDLQIKRDNIIRNDPCNIVITPEHKISIWRDLNKTISELQKCFPREAASIENFILSIVTKGSIYQLYKKMSSRTYYEVLEDNFCDESLKEIFKMFLGCLYEPSYAISAFTAISAIREYIFDGGYYMSGGVGSLGNILAEKFLQSGGDILFGSRVKKIIIKNKAAQGVIVNNDGKFMADEIVSNCDATQTFFKLIGKEYLDDDFIRKLLKVTVSKSALIIYLGLQQRKCDMDSFHYTNSSKVDDILASRSPDLSKIYVIYSSPTNYENHQWNRKQSIALFTGVPYMDKEYWIRNKKIHAENLVRSIESVIGPIRNEIDYMGIATPVTLENFTCNQEGAFRGWAPIMNQDKLALPFSNILKGLSFVGHWSTNIGRGGLPAVVFSGKSVAEYIIGKR